MGWNHRILAHNHHGEVYLQIHEVYYNEQGVPDSHTEKPVIIGSEELKGIKWTLARMKECTKKPILWTGDKFPQEVKVKYRCELCGRDTFDKPTPHNCNTGYRKRGLKWTTIYS